MGKLKPCKSCGKDVAENTKTCPSCGQTNPGINNKEMLRGCAGIIILSIFVSMVLSLCSKPAPKLPIDRIYNLKTVGSMPAEDWHLVDHKTRINTAIWYQYQNADSKQKDHYIEQGWGALLKDADELEKCVSKGISAGDYVTSGYGFQSCHNR